MKDTSLMGWARGQKVEQLHKPPGAHFKPAGIEEDEPTQPMGGALPIIKPATLDELPAPTAVMEQPLMEEIRALQMVYCFLRGLSHVSRQRVLKVVVLWLGEMSPDARDKELGQRVADPLIPEAQEDQADV